LSDYGTFSIDEDGNWTFVADDEAVEGLKTTEEVTFAITVSDGHGGSATETVTITLEGTEDTAEISGENEGEVTEDGTTTASGALSVSDRDADDTGFETATAADLAGEYGDFTFDEATGAWTYELRNGDANVQALDSDDSVTDTLVVSSADGTATETITVTINGADEAPSYTSPPVFTGTGDPNDFDGLGNPAGLNTSSDASNDPDLMYGGAGDDTINAGGDNDTVYGGSGNDALNGNNDNDTLYGGSGNDVVQGSNNNDVLVGGYGADTLTGGNGSDKFTYLSALDTGDTIVDFALGDKIDLSAFAPTGFVGLLASAGAVGANEVGYFVDAGVMTIYVDTDGIAGADLEIDLGNGYVPSAGDFLF
jgi:VCBS repeat-containing protein